MALEYGINFNTENGLKEAQDEIKKWQKEFQGYLKANPLDIGFGAKSFGKDITKSADGAKKSVKSINDEIKALREAFRGLELGDSMKEDGDTLIEMFLELKDKAGKYAGTIDAAAKSEQQIASESLTKKIKDLSNSWNELSLAQREGGEGQTLIGQFIELTESAGMYSQSLAKVAAEQNAVTASESLKDQLNNLSQAWDKLSESQRRGAGGLALVEEFRELRASAGEYVGSIQEMADARDLLFDNSEKGQMKYLDKLWEGLSVEERKGQAGRDILEQYKYISQEAGVHLGSIKDVLRSEEQRAEATKVQTKEVKKQSDAFNQLKSYAMNFLSVYAGIRMIKNLYTISGELELQLVSMQAILQSAEKGAAIFDKIKGLAVISPFQFSDLVSYTKQLSAFSVPYRELYDTTKMLADVSSGLGVGMDRIILAYGQVRSASVLRGQELRQFTEAGIPLVDELAKKFTELNKEVVSAGEVFELISERKVPFQFIKEIFEDMTAEGGKFYMMQEKQADTLQGKINNLKDTYTIMMHDIGEQQDGLLKGSIDALRKLMDNYETIGAYLKALVIGYGAYRASVASVMAIHKLMNLQSYIDRWREARVAIRAAKTATDALAASQAAAATTASIMGGVIGVLVTVGVALYGAYQNAGKAQRELDDIMSKGMATYQSSSNTLDRLIKQLKNTTEGTEEFREVVARIKREFGDFIQDQISVADGYDKIAEAAKKAKVAMGTAAKAKMTEDLEAKLIEQSQDKIQKGIQKLKDSGMTQSEVEKYISLAKANAKQFSNFNNVVNSGLSLNTDATKGIHLIAMEMHEIEQRLEGMRGEVNSMFSDIPYDLREKIKQIKDAATAEIEAQDKIEQSAEATVAAKEQIHIDHLKKLEAIYSEAGLSITEEAIEVSKELDKLLDRDFTDFQNKVKEIATGLGADFLQIGDGDDDRTVMGYIKRIRSEYEELTARYSTLSTVKDDKTQYQVKRLKEQMTQAEALSKALGFTLVEEKKPKGGGKKEADDTLKKYLENVTAQVNEYKERFNIYKAMTEKGNNADMDFEFTFNGEPNLAEFIKKQIKAIGGESLNLAIDFKTAKFEDLNLGDNLKEEEVAKLKSLFDELRKMSLSEYQDVDKLLAKYASYTTRKAELDRNYIKEKKALFDANADSSEVVEQLRVYREESDKLLMEFAKKDDVFNQFVTSIATQSVDRLRFMLMQLQSELVQSKVQGMDSESLVTLKAKIQALEEALKSAKTDINQVNDIEDSYKSWKRLQSVLTKVNKTFDDIGNNIGGLAGEIISTAGEVTTSTLQMVNGITMLANWSVESTKMAAEGAGKSLQAVEKASVILAIVGAALQILTKISGFFIKDTQISQEVIDQYNSLVSVINEVTDAQREMLDALSGRAARAQLEESINLLRMQRDATVDAGKAFLGSGKKDGFIGIGAKDSQGERLMDRLKKYKKELKSIGIEYDELNNVWWGDKGKELFDVTAEQIELLKLMPHVWGSLGSEVQEYLNTLQDVEQKIKELEEAHRESITGVSFDELKGGLDDFLMSADSTFDDVAKNFETHMLQAMLRVVKAEYLNKAMGGWYENFAGAMDDGVLSEDEREELEQAYIDMAEKAKLMYDTAVNISGLERTASDNLSGISKGVAEMTENTALILGGYLDSIRFRLFQYFDYMQSPEQAGAMALMVQSQNNMIFHLQAIEANTKVTADTNTAMLTNLNKVISVDGTRGSFGITVNT